MLRVQVKQARLSGSRSWNESRDNLLTLRLPILLGLLSGALAAADLGPFTTARTAPATERIVFPPDPSVLDVRRDVGAKGDGIADDTAALQAGIAASSHRGKDNGTKILYLPNGTYRVTSNLVVNAGVGPWVYGESRDGVVIRLADGLPTNVTAVLRTHPSETQARSADFFMRNFRNLTIDVGRNPHADGIRWHGNNSSILKNVRVVGTGRVGINSGWLGQNGPSLIQDALVEGSFETGVRCAWSWGQTLSRVAVRKARAVGVYVNATAVGIEDLVVDDTPVALHNEYPNDWKWWGGVVALVGGRFTGGDPGQPAITNSSVRWIMGLGFGRVIGGDKGRFIVDDQSAPVVKFMHLQAFGGRPPVVENRSATNTLVVESCDLKVLGNGRGDIFVTDCPSGIELRSPGQRLWARQLNPEGDSDTGLVQNHGGRLWALGVKHEGRGVRFLTDGGGQTEILGLFNYAPDIAKDDLRPAFDIVDADFSAAGVREISFGNTYPVKARERRGEEVRSEKGGGWIGWALFRSGANRPVATGLRTIPGSPAFPLKVSENRRTLVDQDNQPVCVRGNTGWTLCNDVSLAGADTYLQNRRPKGFSTMNVLLVSAGCNHVVTNGGGAYPGTITALRATDGDTVIIDLPGGTSYPTVDLSKISGGSAKGWWYDPRTGPSTLVGSLPTPSRNRTFPLPGGNDWVLVLDDATQNLAAPGPTAYGEQY